MKTIWKYPIKSDRVTISMPVNAEVLCCQLQDSTPTLWACVDSDAPLEARRFIAFGTGHTMPDTCMIYIGTFQLGGLVFHVFELPLEDLV